MIRTGRKFVLTGFAIVGVLLGAAIASSSPAFAATYSQTVLSDAPAAYYQFQETSGTTFADSTGNGRTGTLIGSYRLAQPGPLPASGDQSVQMSYSSAGYGTVADATVFNSTTSWSLEAWINTSNPGAQQGIVEKYSGTNGFALRLLGGTVNFYVQGSGVYQAVGGTAIVGNTWYHVVATFDSASTTALLYINGALDAGTRSLSVTETAPSGISLKVGARGDDGSFPFQGNLAEVAFYSTALSAARVGAHYQASGNALAASPTSATYPHAVLADQPTVYYRMDEASGQLLQDASGNNYNALLTGSFTRGQTSSLANESDPSTGLSGGRGDVFSSPALDSTTLWSLEAWFTTTNAGAQQGIIERYSGNSGFALRLIGGSMNFYVLGSAGTYQAVGQAAILNNTWYHVVATYDSAHSTALLYLNGALDAGTRSLTVTEALPSGVSLKLGARGDDGSFGLQGKLDEVAIYPTALSAARVQAHYQSSANAPAASSTSGAYARSVISDQPSVYYRMDEASGQLLQDSSGNNYPALLTGSFSRSQASPLLNDSDPSTSLTGGFGNIFTSSAVDSTTGWTLEAWVNTTNAANQQGIIEKYAWDCCQGNYALRLQNAVVTAYTVQGQSASGVGGTTAIQSNAWYYVVATYDRSSSALKVYVNGRLEGSSSVSVAPASSTVPVRIGARGDGALTFSGLMDEVAIYPRALSTTRIQAHYQAAGYQILPTGGPVTASETAGGGLNVCFPCLAQKVVHGQATPNPIDTESGSFWHTFTDISISGRSYPLQVVRTYDSQNAASTSPFGYGWKFNYGMSLSSVGSTTTITQENGSQTSFTLSGSVWTPSAPRLVATLTHNGDGTWTFARQGKDTYTFNASGQLASMTDLNGYVTSLSYTNGNLTTITDPAGRTLTLGWTGSRITSLTDANMTPSRTVTYAYDGSGNLQDAVDVGGGDTRFTYDTSHRVTVMKDPKCQALGAGCPGVQNHYDAAGRVDWQKDQLNRQTSFTYAGDPQSVSGGTTTVTDPKGNVTQDVYQSGLRTYSTRGYGTPQAATTRYIYDQTSAAPIAIVDPNGNSTTMTVDANGNQLTITDPLGRVTTKTYNSLNEVLTDQDGNGVTTSNAYDTRGNLLTVSRALTGTSQVQTTTYNHNDASHPGDVTSMVDADSKTWTYGYDSTGYRNSVIDPLGNRATSTFNNEGWKTASVTPKGNVAGCGCTSQYTTAFAYNAFGQLTTQTDPLGHSTIRHFDADQNMDTFTEGDGNLTTYVFDLANEQVQVKRADSPQTTLTTDYNADGTVLDQKDGKNNAILTYGYDALARLTSSTDALSNVTSYTYDAASNRLTKQDSGGSCSATPKTGCTTFTYDVANQLKTITYSDGVTPNVTTISYDNDGQRTAMTDGTGSSVWVWDSLHRMTSYTNGGGAQVRYVYNLRNLPTTITYPGSLNVARGFDDAGRLASVQDWLGNTTSFGYDANSNLTTETLPAGTGIVDTFSVDAADRLTAISDVKGGSTILFSATYSRDNANQLVSDSSMPSATGSYRYTTLNQVCYAGSSGSMSCATPPSGATAYVYDASDNLTQMGNSQQAFNSADQLCWTASAAGSCAAPPSGATRYSYDARGNRTQVMPPNSGATILSYDQANRLTGYGSSATYSYNGDGLRMSKSISGTTTQFLWDLASSLPLLLKDGSTAYISGPAGLPLEQVNGSSVSWLHHDQLGSTRLVTDNAGQSQATYAFDAYGSLTATTGTVNNPLRYAGQYLDAESNLYQMRARYYDPGTGQFLSRDPAAASTREPYSYVGGSPINRLDPSGLCDWNPLSGGFCGYQALSQTPLGLPLSKVAGDAAAGVGYGHDHAVAGWGGCDRICYGTGFQGGDLNVSLGGVGVLQKGLFAGWASKKANERHSQTAVCSVALGLGVSINVGAEDPTKGDLDWSDVEVDLFTGVGWQFGYSQSGTVVHDVQAPW